MKDNFIAVISPAKRIESGVSNEIAESTLPMFMEESTYLTNKLKKLSAKKISSLMSVSTDIGQLNQERFANWNPNFISSNSDVSLLTFKGDVFRGMGADDFSLEEMKYANSHIRILSGLYGLLKPMDLMMPYRLEMGTRFSVTPKIKNLYQFWGDKIANALADDLGQKGVLLNLASNEYIKAVPKKSIGNKRIEFKFLDLKNGDYKAIMTYSKLARGYMCRFIVKNKISDYRDLRAFDSNNYLFSDSLSTEDTMVYTRDVVQL